MLNNVKRALITVLTLSFTVVGVLLAPSTTFAYTSSEKSSQHYRLEVSQTSNTQVSITWAPLSQANSRYIDFILLTGDVGNNGDQRYIYLALYDSGSISCNISSGVVTNWSLTQNSTYNVGSELYNTNQINNSVINIANDIADLNNFLVTMNSNNLQTQAYVSNINTQIQNIISNGLSVRLQNYDLLLSQIPVYAYFIGQNATVQKTNDFIGGNILLFDYPILKGYENLSPTTSNSLFMYPGVEYIFIVIWNRTSALFNGNNYYFESMSGYTNPTVVQVKQNTLNSTCIVNSIKLINNDTQSRFIFHWTDTFVNYLNNYQFIPLYFGPTNECPDEFLHLANYKTSEEEELSNNESAFNDSVDDLNEIESDYNDELDSQLQNIDTNFDFEDEFGSSFLSSGQWVVTQFNYIINNSPIGGIIKFSLIIGIALLIIGKKRGK